MVSVIGQAGRVGGGSSGRKELHVNEISLKQQMNFGIGGHFAGNEQQCLFQRKLGLIERQQYEVQKILRSLESKRIEKAQCPAIKSRQHQLFARCVSIYGRAGFSQCVAINAAEPGSCQMNVAHSRQSLCRLPVKRINDIGIQYRNCISLNTVPSGQTAETEPEVGSVRGIKQSRRR